MANDSLIEILDQCVTRLADGATIDECEQLYPEHKNELRVMLEATRIPQKAQVSADDLRYSQARVRLQFEKALIQTTNPRRLYPLQRIASILLLLLFVGSLLTSGVVVVAQDSIPGDTLYSVKRLSEQVHLSITSDKTALQDTFNQRRIEETKRVIQLRREVDVRFMGIIEVVTGSVIHVSDLVIEVTEPIQTIGFMEGMRVDISARTRLDQTLLATAVHILEVTDPNLQSDERPTITPTLETFTPTATTITPTATDTLSTREPTATPSRPTPEDTSTTHPTVDPTLTDADASATESPTLVDDCDVSPPSEWIDYTIQPGDTPLGIAIGTDISLEQFFDVNCDLNPRLIIAGDVVYVPHEPRLSVTPTALEIPTDRLSDVTIVPTQEPTSVIRDVRPTATPSREKDKPSDQRERDKGDQKEGGDGR